MLKSPLSPNKNRDFFDKLKAPSDEGALLLYSRSKMVLASSMGLYFSFQV